ncbi:MAG: HAMP domain-containing sensor histidine kinase, partial [Pygmaiobacter sp.]|nr:HAMP domain-containing sensor histidine kinase [Pygmaiobacter sp.]
ATEKIKKQELEFSITRSSIQEINAIFTSMDAMRAALKTALESQWRLEEGKNEQMSALAHDLKTPLTVIRGNADLLGETPLTDEQQQYTGYIAESTLQMQSYIKALIDISKNKAATACPPQRQALPLAGFLAQIAAQAQALCAPNGVTVALTEQEPLPATVQADPALCKRAILNVITNALEHSPPGGRITIHAAAGGGWLSVAVLDEGTGFSAEALRHAKEQFYRADRSRGDRLHYGMGLYIATTIMAQHGGKLTLANAPTGGGLVTLALPCP